MDNRNIKLITAMTQDSLGILFGDKVYISIAWLLYSGVTESK